MCKFDVNDIVGQRVGRLTVLNFDHKEKHKNNGGHTYFYKCKCDCGNIVIISRGHLTSNHTKSCGCYKLQKNIERLTIHGLRNTKLYNVWCGIKNRCSNPSQISYPYYGTKGITICDEWKNDFKAFYDWSIQNGYKDNLSIDRIDVNGNYEPSNCRWATNLQQARNKSNNVYLTYKNETHCLSEWAEKLNITVDKLRNLLKKGFSISDIIFQYLQ